MSIPVFTINNLTSSQQGPYGQGQIVVPANGTVSVSPPLCGLLSDNNFISALVNVQIYISINATPIPSGIIFPYFSLLGSATYPKTYQNITGNTTVTVKSGYGTFCGMIIGDGGTGGVATLYDSTSGSGTIIATFTMGSPAGGLLSSVGNPTPGFIGPFDILFTNGLTVVTSGSNNNNITIIYL